MFQSTVEGNDNDNAFSMEAVIPAFDPNPTPLITAVRGRGGNDVFRHAFNNPEAFYTTSVGFGGRGDDTYGVYLDALPDRADFARIASDIVFNGGAGTDTMLFSILPNDVNGPQQAVDIDAKDFRPDLTSVEVLRFEIGVTGRLDGGSIAHAFTGSSRAEDLYFVGPNTGGDTVSVTLDLGGGKDTVEAWLGYLGVTVRSYSATVKGGNGADTIQINGSQSLEDDDIGADIKISGGRGRDAIYGSLDLREIINGGRGNDVIYLDAGSDGPFSTGISRNVDIVSGGPGRDTFVVANPDFAAIFRHQVAEITDFWDNDTIAFAPSDDVTADNLSYDRRSGVLELNGFTLIEFEPGTRITNDQFVFDYEIDLAFV